MLKQLITGREKGKCIGSFFNRASALNDSALHFYEVVEEDSCVEQEGSEHQAEGDRCPRTPSIVKGNKSLRIKSFGLV